MAPKSKNGNKGLIKFCMGIPVILVTIKRFIAIGGVIAPTPMETNKITPNWIGSIPMEMAVGSNNGVKMKINTPGSRKKPVIKKTRTINKMMIYGLAEILVNPSATAWGTPFNTRIRVKMITMGNIIMKEEKVTPNSIKDL